MGDIPTAKKRRLTLGTSYVSPFYDEKYKDRCWYCKETITGAKSSQNCPSCPRVFHKYCLKARVNTYWKCSPCLTMRRSEALSGQSQSELNELIQIFLRRLKTEDKLNIIEPKKMFVLETKTNAGAFKSSKELLDDMQWIRHFSLIECNAEWPERIDTLYNFSLSEVKKLELCWNCYRNSIDDNWFTKVCDPPHKLVWAKVRGFPYWPAKQMHTISDKVCVQFFGKHEVSILKFEHISSYTDNLYQSLEGKYGNDMKICLEEVNLYLENYRQIFGDSDLTAPTEEKTPIHQETAEPCAVGTIDNSSNSDSSNEGESSNDVESKLVSLVSGFETKRKHLQKKISKQKDKFETEIRELRNENLELKKMNQQLLRQLAETKNNDDVDYKTKLMQLKKLKDDAEAIFASIP